ncbi:MAG: endonuclease V [Acidobacteriota bacterium]
MFDYKRAVKTQQILSNRLNLVWNGSEVKTIGGADCSYDHKNSKVYAKMVVCRLSDLRIIDSSEAAGDLVVPYAPGFLSFREAPAYIKSFERLNTIPDVILIDGNGIAHPRKMGVASFIGVVLDIPTIGCAKSPFFPFTLPDKKRGAYTWYRNKKNEEIGYCLRTQTDIKPIFVSPGNKIDFETSLHVVLKCSKFRIPEPIRYAHKQATDLLKNQ